jgi:hypothetical protein
MFDTLLRNTRDPLSSAIIVGAPAARRSSTDRGWLPLFSIAIFVWISISVEPACRQGQMRRNAKASPLETAPRHPSPGRMEKNESIPISGLGPLRKESSRKPSRKFPVSPARCIFLPGDTPRNERRINKVRHNREAIGSLLSAADTETTPLAHSLSRNERPPATRST